jgi:hypothetical protein
MSAQLHPRTKQTQYGMAPQRILNTQVNSRQPSAGKITTSVFWDSVKTIHVECLSHATVNAQFYSKKRTLRTRVPLWTAECGDGVRARKRAPRQFQAHPTLDSLIPFKRFLAKAQRVVREATHTSWMAFVCSLYRSTC